MSSEQNAGQKVYNAYLIFSKFRNEVKKMVEDFIRIIKEDFDFDGNFKFTSRLGNYDDGNEAFAYSYKKGNREYVAGSIIIISNGEHKASFAKRLLYKDEPELWFLFGYFENMGNENTKAKWNADLLRNIIFEKVNSIRRIGKQYQNPSSIKRKIFYYKGKLKGYSPKAKVSILNIGYRLSDITCSEDLKEKVVKPLQKLSESFWKCERTTE